MRSKLACSTLTWDLRAHQDWRDEYSQCVVEVSRLVGIGWRYNEGRQEDGATCCASCGTGGHVLGLHRSARAAWTGDRKGRGNIASLIQSMHRFGLLRTRQNGCAEREHSPFFDDMKIECNWVTTILISSEHPTVIFPQAEPQNITDSIQCR